MTIAFSNTAVTLGYIYQCTGAPATGGGGTFPGLNLAGQAAFNYFSDTAVVNDALYFMVTTNGYAFSELVFNIGTPLAASTALPTIVWEYMYSSGAVWTAIPNFRDDTAGFTASGVKSFVFGLPYNWWTWEPVNGVAASVGFLAIRARISNLNGGTITEGGANATTAVAAKNHKITISGTSDGSPATFTDIYNYVNGSYPYLGAKKQGNYFDFRSVNLVMNSRVKSNSEVIEIANYGDAGYIRSSQSNLDYLQLGTKLGTKNGTDGSVLYINSQANCHQITFSANTKIYGSTVIGKPGPGYPSMDGEWLGSTIDGINFANGSGTFTNNKIIDVGTYVGWTSGTFSQNRMVLPNMQMLYLYDTSYVFSDLDWEAPSATGNSLLFVYMTTNANPTWTFLNPLTTMPNQTSNSPAANQMAYRCTGAATDPTTAWSYVGGAWTDVTTAIKDATANDVPVGGTTNDCLYLLLGGEYPSGGIRLDVTSSQGSNNFVYAYEYWNGAAWTAFQVWDRTSNLAATASLWLGNFGTVSAVTVQSVSGNWIRIRVVTAGTGTPKISKLQYAWEAGCSGWAAYEKYTVDATIKNTSDVAISGATVVLSYAGVTQATLTTAVDGTITQQQIAYKKYFFDPINYYTNWYQIGQTTYGNYTLTVTAPGYDPQVISIPPSAKQNLTVRLKPVLLPGRIIQPV